MLITNLSLLFAGSWCTIARSLGHQRLGANVLFEMDVKQPTTAAQLAFEAADAQRKLCRDWLIYIMTSSPTKTRTKADLCNEAMRRFKVSKGSFDAGWTWAIEETGQHQWYEPLRRRAKNVDPQRKSPILNQ